MLKSQTCKTEIIPFRLHSGITTKQLLALLVVIFLLSMTLLVKAQGTQYNLDIDGDCQCGNVFTQGPHSDGVYSSYAEAHGEADKLGLHLCNGWGGDCNDNDANVHGYSPCSPTRREYCNGLDDDCDGTIDGPLCSPITSDFDGDGYSYQDGDCNNDNAAIYPGATEICDQLDNNCNGQVDEGFSYYLDNDGDGYGTNSSTTFSCSGVPSGYASQGGDANDNDGSIHPGVWDGCDNIDNDGDGQFDEDGTVVSVYIDADGDGYGTGTVFTITIVCGSGMPSGYSTNNTDFNDFCLTCYPGSTELCDGMDNTGEGQIDEGLTQSTFYRDVDGDGYGNPSNSTSTCAAPAGYVTDNTDCNDNCATCHPGGTEICGNMYDEDCNGIIDGCVFDVDLDGYTNLTGDCDDANANVHPGAHEICNNGIDENCDGHDDTAIPGTPTNINGNSKVCIGETLMYCSSGLADATSYSWNLPPGVRSTSGSNITYAPCIEVEFMPGFTGGGIRVLGMCSCGSGSLSAIFPVSKFTAAPGTPTAINGVTAAQYGYCGGGTYTFTTTSTNVRSYHWSITGGTIIGTANSSSYTVTLPSSYSSYIVSVYATNCIGTSSTRSLTIRSVPAQPPTITGPLNNIVCPLGTNYNFSVSALPAGALSLTWSASGGASVSSSLGTSASINFPNNPIFTSSVVTVVGSNLCGSGTGRSVTVTKTPLTPGTISGPSTVCKTSSPIQTYSLATGVSGADNYTWTGSSILIKFYNGSSYVSSLTTTSLSVSVDFSGAPTGNRTVRVVANNSCGSSSLRSKTVSVSSCREGFDDVNDYEENDLSVFPNPASTQLTLTFKAAENEKYKVIITDVLSRIVAQQDAFAIEGSNILSFGVADFNKGIYIIQFEKGDVAETKRIVIE